MGNKQASPKHNMARYYNPAYSPVTRGCAHAVPLSLARKLHWLKSCPTCLTKRLVGQLELLQLLIAKHGGIFKQKEIYPIMHKIARRKWVVAKMEMQNSIDRFKDLLKDEEMGAEGEAMLKEALQVWEKKKSGLSRVPGVHDSDEAEEKEASEEEKEGARLLMVWLTMVLNKEMSQEEEEEEQEDVATLTLSELYQQGLAVSQHKSLESTTPSITSPQNNTYASPQQRPLSSTTSTPNSTPATLFEPQQDTSVPPTSLKTPITPPSTETWQNIATPRSSLKRPRTNNPPDSLPAPPAHKRVRIADRVTISPDHLNIVNPLPFETLPRTKVTMPHAAHSTAEHSREKRLFHRRQRSYVPGAWASRASSEKANTSFFRIPDGEMKKLVLEELGREEKAEETARQLKLVGSRWLVLWWAKHVVPQLDLERLLAEMGRRKSTEKV